MQAPISYCHKDGSSFANTHQVRATNYTVNLFPHLSFKKLDSKVVIDIEVLQQTAQIVLDVLHLNVVSVVLPGYETSYTLGKDTCLGQSLIIKLNQPLTSGSKHHLEIESWTDNSNSLTWGNFVFTQNQPTYCRSLFPCQDTPSVKSAFTTQITLDEADTHLHVYATGIRRDKTNQTSGNPAANVFDLRIPIPTYLFAFLIGDFRHYEISPRIGVICQPHMQAACLSQLKDMEKYLETLESLAFPYRWGRYDLCVLPMSFPYGGMENPLITFASPSIITGDGTGTSVVIHEMAHSWTGNLVSCLNWENFWLNEGFTVYLQNNAIRKLYGEEHYNVVSLADQTTLKETIDRIGVDHTYTALHPQLNHEHPDDAFSVVPYYKGFIFLTHLEQLVGLENFLGLVRSFLAKYEQQSVDYLQFKTHFEEYTQKNNIQVKEQIDWEKWVRSPGYPLKQQSLFKSSRVERIGKLVQDFVQGKNKEQFEKALWSLLDNTDPLNTKLLELFFQRLQQKPKIDKDQLQQLQTHYHLGTRLLNYELLTEWFKICLSNDYLEVLGEMDTKVLKKTGRMKFIRPLYRALYSKHPDLAQELFRKNCHLYSVIASDMVRKDLKLTL